MADFTRTQKSPIDATAWPAVAAVPMPRGGSVRTKLAEAAFARACAKAGLALEGESPDLTVERAEVFQRVAARGWTGLAEGYMAGEWSTTSSQVLVDDLVALVGAGYRPVSPRPSAIPGGRRPVGAAGELPPDLTQHFAGSVASHAQGHFGTGVPTTERTRVKSHTPGAGRGNEPSHHFMDVTDIGAPLDAHRDDLTDAQLRSVAMLLEAASTNAGTHLLEMPCSGGAVVTQAVAKRITVDTVSFDERIARGVEEQLIMAGAEGSARVDLLSSTAEIPELAHQRRGVYDAVVSMNAFEALPATEQTAYLQAAEEMLAPGGRVAVQTIVRTGAFSRAAGAALTSLRPYTWPRLNVVTVDDIGSLVDKYTGLRVTAVTTAPEHLAASLKLQRMTFDAHLRDAAADGYDVVFRRMWTWQFALREALARLGMLDLAQVTMVQRHRRGRR